MTQEDFEKKVMKVMLEGDDEPYNFLRRQYENATITKREFTEHGFFTHYEVPDEYSVVNVRGTIGLAATFEDTDYGYLLILFVGEGKIEALEGATNYDEWDYNYENAVLTHGDERANDIKGY
jgi:hypothetical protein